MMALFDIPASMQRADMSRATRVCSTNSGARSKHRIRPQRLLRRHSSHSPSSRRYFSKSLGRQHSIQQAPGAYTPSRLKARNIVHKYQDLSRMNSTSLPTTNKCAMMDFRLRKKMLWEMYATAFDIVAVVKASARWPTYIVSSDQMVLKVVRKVYKEMVSPCAPSEWLRCTRCGLGVLCRCWRIISGCFHGLIWNLHSVFSVSR
ncbi:hypothetical protein EJ02DRAFT_183202 [Clathrospora elynae]|uniref:Uncharacterized protein n=1 Tax=Clathrospora elynae TaxID=706981 RepID=A0A6A5SYQ3_9PLEO|nr:hypothetical protein EJ02DRAFT_183202 [Clathrospora elynae]